jgi:hypothetical protein
MEKDPRETPADDGGHGGGRKGSRPGAVLSELLVKVAGEPLQVEVSAVWVLPELLGFLLKLLIADF